MDIKDKTIIITGAARGLGKAFALRFAKQGANLALVDLNEEELKKTSDQCRGLGITVYSYLANVSEETEVVSLLSDVERDLGCPQGMINNAGITRDGLLVKKKDEQIEAMSLENWQQVIDVNLTGVFLCGRETIQRMIRNDSGGVIVNISSISAAGNFGQTNYSAAKAGVTSLTVTWAKELAKHGIRVGAIAPGFVNTEMVAAMPAHVLEKTVGLVPLKRLAEPDEVAHTAQFIFENDYFTGRMIELDGGLRI